MKTLILSTIFLLTFQYIKGQTDNPDSTETITNNWRGPCCNDNGFEIGVRYAAPIFVIESFKDFTPIEINIKTVKLGSQKANVNFKFKSKIEGDTKILNLNDTFGIKLVLAKTVENNAKKYLYKLLVFRKYNGDSCWHSLSSFFFYDVYTQKMPISGFGIGDENTSQYFEITDGWIRFD